MHTWWSALLKALTRIFQPHRSPPSPRTVAQGQVVEPLQAYDVLMRSLARLTHEPDLDAFLGHVLTEIVQQVNASSCHIFLFDAEHETLALHMSWREGQIFYSAQPDEPELFRAPFPADISPIFGYLCQARQVCSLIEKKFAGFAWPGVMEWFRRDQVTEALCLALMAGDRPVGILGLRFHCKFSLMPEERELIHALSNQATLAIQLTNLAEEAKQTAIFKEREQAAQDRLAELMRANEVLQASLSKLADEPELEKFLGHVLTVCSERFGAPEAGIWRYESGLFRLFVAYEQGQIKLQEEISHPGADLDTARKIHNQEVLSRLRKREIICDYEEDFATRPVYEHFRDYFRQRGIKTALKIPLFLDDDLRGILVLRFCDRHVFKPEEAELAFALGNQVVLAIELTRLAEMAKAAAIIEERNRMARDIHDTLAQTFTSILMRLQTVSLELAELPNGRAAELKADIDRACALARDGLASARHSVQTLRPRSLDGRSLAEALIQALHQMTEGTALQSHFQVMGDPYALPENTEMELFRIAQEAITNSCKHARAQHIWVRLGFEPESLCLAIEDDGSGFALTESTALKGFGLISMQQRAERIGARLILNSEPGSGTQIYVVVEVEP